MLDIMVPFWGDPAYLRATVRSVLDQTDPTWRLVVVDDCYPDPEVERYVTGLDDPRVHYVRNETNLGITDNYRRCLELATADWMVFLGCDDLLLPGYVAAVSAATADADPSIDVVQPGVVVVDEDGRETDPLVDKVKRRLFAPRGGSAVVLTGEDLAVSLLRGNWTYWPSLALRTDAIRRQRFVDGFPLIQDLALLLDLALSGSSLLVLRDEVFAYRRHANSASAVTVADGGRFAGERAYFAIAAERCAAAGWPRAARAARLHPASRLYAASELPGAVRTASWPAIRELGRHALGR